MRRLVAVAGVAVITSLLPGPMAGADVPVPGNESGDDGGPDAYVLRILGPNGKPVGPEPDPGATAPDTGGPTPGAGGLPPDAAGLAPSASGPAPTVSGPAPAAGSDQPGPDGYGQPGAAGYGQPGAAGYGQAGAAGYGQPGQAADVPGGGGPGNAPADDAYGDQPAPSGGAAPGEPAHGAARPDEPAGGAGRPGEPAGGAARPSGPAGDDAGRNRTTGSGGAPAAGPAMPVVKPVTARPVAVRLVPAKPVRARPAAKPAAVRLVPAKPVRARPAAGKPVRGRPAHAEPVRVGRPAAANHQRPGTRIHNDQPRRTPPLFFRDPNTGLSVYVENPPASVPCRSVVDCLLIPAGLGSTVRLTGF